MLMRYITFSSYFVEMKKEGSLKPHGIGFSIPRKNYITFEKNWRGDAYFKAVFIMENTVPGISFSPNDLIALIFNEHDLLIKGYQIYDTIGIEEQSELKSMLLRGEITQNEYESIGNIVYVKEEIPLTYLVNVDIPDTKRLNQLGLI